jgi:hypothetical protein
MGFSRVHPYFWPSTSGGIDAKLRWLLPSLGMPVFDFYGEDNGGECQDGYGLGLAMTDRVFVVMEILLCVS